MNRTIGIVVGALIVLVLVLYNTTYTVNFHEIAIVTRFGKPAGVITEPGLHMKAPFGLIRGSNSLRARWKPCSRVMVSKYWCRPS